MSIVSETIDRAIFLIQGDCQRYWVAGLVSNALKLVDQSIRFCSRWAVV